MQLNNNCTSALKSGLFRNPKKNELVTIDSKFTTHIYTHVERKFSLFNFTYGLTPIIHITYQPV